MRNLIKIDPENKIVKILLGDNYESFELYTKDWRFERYVQQWKDATKLLLDTGNTVCLIKHYEAAKNSVRTMRLYTIFPKKTAYPLCDDISDDEFLVTESFIFITQDEKVLTTSFYYDKIFDSYSNYFPIYYFDPDRIEHFYLYLNERTNGISTWQVSRLQLGTILELRV
ncbi:hypothetical protein CPI40_09025 [Moraxella catarrhalis]|uniref:hypothetical protein n=1 Tax=Moraxella catarrhalis TaxID=480 RepID=UPI0007E3D58A|nr:hypothetical protein [Moraxella catarrhalis]MPW64933.1 hypothetical protein [Moraxella catarrhalis]MPW75237.1 hypothetical protein [Moraxella catarrhalis]MPX29057.1 hypothetical protein [Moraxella catarrhalis]MPY09032.1 hypothetical protein [Moraxella catarrhalis]OBX43817.1 hypothetical protein A9Z57_04655 [Moraxella catarrhalis]